MARADVALSEIQYNPLQGSRYEFVELYNPAEVVVDMSGWALIGGITWTFGPDTTIAAGGYLVVANDRAALLGAYPALAPEIVVGDWAGDLDNAGEELALLDARGRIVEGLTYDDDAPWDFLADGFGGSLERLCFDESALLPENWRTGRVPTSELEFGGSPGRANGAAQCPPSAPARPRVLFSEVLYHAVLEESLEEEHEFVEIHNASAEAVDLSGWRIAGGIDYEFPAGASIAAGGYRVIAANPEALAAVEAYGLNAADLLGGYERRLDNGGEKLALIGAGGQGIDSVTYDDDFPWPIAADGLGTGKSWLDASLLPLEDHRYRGYSLERVSFDAPSGAVSTWAPSPLDGATPGRANASARAEPEPIVDRISVRETEGGTSAILADQEARIEVGFSPRPPAAAVSLELFVEDVAREDEPVESFSLADDGLSGGDLVAGDGLFTALLPPRAENTIVRYRIVVDRGGELEPLSPRPTDPARWHAYFVRPVIQTETPVYQIFISPRNWGQMWTNIQGGRANGCGASATWNRKVDAIFVYGGEVHDAHVRYQGSRWNRSNGPNLRSWPRPSGPDRGPNPPKALSWRISLPRHSQHQGRTQLTLNKLTQGCPGYNAGVGYRLFAERDIPAPLTQFVRLHINGSYYHYMMEYERPGEDMLRRFHREQAEKHPELPREEVGHFFKSVGCNCDEGPYGWGDSRPLSARCGFTREDRYAWTYPRKTHDWAGNEEFVAMMDAFHAARRQGTDAMRAYFAEQWDVDLLLDYLAIINWSVPFDDMFQNHFFYQRLIDGKWLLTPWDLDRNFGEWKGSNASIYMGESGVSDNRSGWWNYLKDGFLKSYRQEFDDRLLLLNNTLLAPEHIAELVDEVTAEANPQEAAAAPAGVNCGGAGAFAARANSFKSFARSRHDIVNSRIANVTVNAGADRTVFAGSEVTFDATASTPDPGPDAEYRWDNGMEGESPTLRLDEAGTFTFTLTILFHGSIPFTDEVTITVLPMPEKAFRERDGLVVMEAENFTSIDPHQVGDDVNWQVGTEAGGFSGSGYLEAAEIGRRRTFLSRYAGFAPEARYVIRFETPGTYRIWLRALAVSSRSDTVHVNLEGTERSGNFAQQFTIDESSYLWSGDTRREGPQTVEVRSPGLTFLTLWIRESGVIVDKILLTRDLETAPEGTGPLESPLLPVGGSAEPFVRGDVDQSGSLTVTDAVAILFHLFRGSSRIECADHADVDDDGKLSITDAVRLLDYLFRAGPPPAAPFPAAGLDPTEDANGCGGP